MVVRSLDDDITGPGGSSTRGTATAAIVDVDVRLLILRSVLGLEAFRFPILEGGVNRYLPVPRVLGLLEIVVVARSAGRTMIL